MIFLWSDGGGELIKERDGIGKMGGWVVVITQILFIILDDNKRVQEGGKHASAYDEKNQNQ